MLKKILTVLCAVFLLSNAFAQFDSSNQEYHYENTMKQKPSTFKHYFLGGNFLAGFGDGGGSFGINPVLGYSINKYVDVGLQLNAVYDYQKFYTGAKLRTWNLGVAPFARVYPIDFLFFGVSFEENIVSSRAINANGVKQPRQNYTAPSLIGSIGYTTRIYGQSSFFISVGMDFLNNPNSPYRDHYIDNNGMERSTIQPIISTGFTFNLW